ncbi:MAG TPA: HNH endonuclease signature motif containing protein [Actinomycetota bacterium]|nr:HNH endonuclease signature motif containing protein [Actinomycetota bacterium]
MEFTVTPPCNGPNTNRVRNGLQLRAVLHVLFDRHLLTIDKGYRVVLNPSGRRGLSVWKTFRLPASTAPALEDAAQEPSDVRSQFRHIETGSSHSCPRPS